MLPPLSSLSASCCEVDCQDPAREHWAHLHTPGWVHLSRPSQPGPGAESLHQEPLPRLPLRSLTHHWLPSCSSQKNCGKIRLKNRTIQNNQHSTYSLFLYQTAYPISTPFLGLPLIELGLGLSIYFDQQLLITKEQLMQKSEGSQRRLRFLVLTEPKSFQELTKFPQILMTKYFTHSICKMKYTVFTFNLLSVRWSKRFSFSYIKTN